MTTLRLRRFGTPQDPLVEYDSFDQFAEAGTLPSGRFSISYNGIPVDFRYDDRGYDTTVVCFHGAVLTSVDLPFHIGHGVMNDVRANRLAISDPSLLLGEGLKLAWYAGSARQIGVQAFIADVVQNVFTRASSSHLVFFGTSGGGFAALEMSARFPRSLAVAVNPQTSISKYYEGYVDHYVKIAWEGESPFGEAQSTVRHNLISVYPENPVNTVAYIQNTRDSFHARNHEKPFINRVGGSSKVWRLRNAWGNPDGIGHVPPPKPVIAGILSGAADSRGQWDIGLRTVGFVQDD